MDIVDIAGRLEVVSGIQDMEPYIREHLGEEASGYMMEYIRELECELDAWRAGEMSDLAAYESELEENQSAFSDIWDKLQAIKNLLKAQRLNREDIAAYIQEIELTVANQF